jgi:purine-nucleoside/S-methyl-5'-thioadenosine phosphorylase / adenosine deaminase
MTDDAPSLTTAALVARSLGVPHGFFTRQGGVSTGPYTSLNCGLATGDARAAVIENRARAARALGADPAHLFVLKQVHGTEVTPVIGPAWEPGAGPDADAMVTDRPGAVLGIVTADCAPVLFADPEAGVVGAAHAGWRGAAAGVLEATLAAMLSLGAATPRVRAAIGPAIRQPSYEVGPDLRDAVLHKNRADERFFAPGGRDAHWLFDLPGYCAARLAAAGVARIATLEADTLAESERFFSHRRRTLAGGGPIGHQISLVMLPAP